ncbi:MAG: hypothetical protein ACI84C_003002 [Flavobacteriales bacterium]
MDKVDLVRSEKLLIYPNPAGDCLNIETKDIKIDQVQIHYLLGELIIQKDITSASKTIGRRSLQSGIYMITLAQMFTPMH